jgi:dihydrofolate reductase
MLISIIVAMDENRGIGIRGKLPWHLSTDLRRFKRLTMGHHLIMGRNTYENLPKELPGRIIIVMTRNQNYTAKDILIAHSLDEAIDLAKSKGEEEVFIGGGASIYSDTITITDRLYLTLVHTSVEADKFFPKFDRSQWQLKFSSYHEKDSVNQYPHTFTILER